MRIFATGATGFLGNNVLRYLLKEKDAEVFALRRKNRPFIKKFPREPNWIEGSLEGDYSCIWRHTAFGIKIIGMPVLK
jgi:uncharacterized protein YbjT (DUF2867 family)